MQKRDLESGHAMSCDSPKKKTPLGATDNLSRGVNLALCFCGLQVLKYNVYHVNSI